MFEIQHITEQLDKLLPDKKKSSITQLLLPPKKLFFLTVQFYTYFSIDIGSTTLTSSKKRRCSNPRGVWCHFHRGFTPRNNNNKIQLFYRFSQIIKLLRSRKNPTYSRICAWVLHTASTYYFFGLSTIVFSCFCAVFAQFQKKKDSLLPITLEHPSSTISFCFCKNLLYHLHMCHETASKNNTEQNCLFSVFFDHFGNFWPLCPCCYRIVNISYFLSTFPFFFIYDQKRNLYQKMRPPNFTTFFLFCQNGYHFLFTSWKVLRYHGQASVFVSRFS